MTFCFFSAQYLPTVGGVERYTNSLAKKLVQRGHKAIVVTSAICGQPKEEISPEGIKIYRLPVFPLMGGRFPVLKKNSEFRQIKKLLSAENIDFSVIQTRFYTESIFAARFCHEKNIPSIVIEHGTAHLMRGGVTGVLGNIYEHFAFWLIRKYSKEIYGVSKCCCQWLTHFGVNTDKVLYNAVEPIQLEKAITEKAMRTVTANIPPNIKTVICFSGRFIPEKGVIPLVKAFNRLRQIHPATVLLMAGNGPLFESVKALDTENVILLGAVDYPTSLAVFKRSDIFCLPTFSEGFATTVLEAAALNTAILTTPTGGSPELIIDANHGYLFDGMDEETIYIALCKAVSDIIWCKTAAANAKLKLESDFTWDKVCDKLLEIAKN